MNMHALEEGSHDLVLLSVSADLDLFEVGPVFLEVLLRVTVLDNLGQILRVELLERVRDDVVKVLDFEMDLVVGRSQVLLIVIVVIKLSSFLLVVVSDHLVEKSRGKLV